MCARRVSAGHNGEDGRSLFCRLLTATATHRYASASNPFLARAPQSITSGGMHEAAKFWADQNLLVGCLLLALFCHPGMSASRSILGVKRKSHEQSESVDLDPKRTRTAFHGLRATRPLNCQLFNTAQTPRCLSHSPNIRTTSTIHHRFRSMRFWAAG